MTARPDLPLSFDSSNRSTSFYQNARQTHPRCHAIKDAPFQSPVDGLAMKETYRSQLLLYNTMARSKQAFTTRTDRPETVQMYVCGVTVYDFSHIGHARVYVAFDTLYRLLKDALGYQVEYVRNFTDIE